MQRRHPITVAYGRAEEQVGDLYLPAAPAHAPIVCLIHGGFWRARYGRDTIAPLADDLVSRGFAVWNLTYRRAGTDGGGWAATLADIGAGIDRLAQIPGIDTAPGITVIGHSAGGQLALWSAHRCSEFGPRQVRVSAVVGLAPVADLRKADALGLSNGAVREFLGGDAREFGARCRAASPIELLPFGVPQLIIHGARDEDVPVEMSRDYVRVARAAGDVLEYVELEDVGHMELVDPRILRRCGLHHFADDARDLLPDVGPRHPLL